MKAQVQPIVFILISTIIISLVGAAYIWGVPIVQKRTAITEFTAGANAMLAIDSRITDIANSGAGKQAVALQSGFAKVVPYDAAGPDNNSIILEVVVDQPMVSLDQEIPLRTSSLEEVGTFGVNEPRILTVKEVRFQERYKLVFRLHYRELISGGTVPKGFKIALDSADVSSGQEKVAVSFNTVSVQRGQAANGGDLTLALIDVEIV